MNKTIGIFAHVDAGKTTFSEQILYHTKSIRSRGRVDNKEAFLDDNAIEKERGITIFSGIGKFNYKDNKYYLIDTPGHIDFSPEMERSIAVLDYAILLISAVEGIQGHTETIWRLLEKYKIPTFIFINKTDRVGADINKIVEEIKYRFNIDVILMNENETLDKLSYKNIEIIAERDETLLELFLNDEYNNSLWINNLKKLVSSRTLFVVAKGSALIDVGVKEFLDIFSEISYTKYNDSIENNNIKARVFKVKYDDKGNRITFMKILQGSIKLKQDMTYKVYDEEYCEKINEIRSYNGKDFERVSEGLQGEIVGLIGLTSQKPGQGIGISDLTSLDMVPTLRAKVIFKETINPKEILKYFKILEAEDTSLNVLWNEKLQEIQLSIMGKIQLEVLQKTLKNRFNLDIIFGTPEILYKETIEGETYGYGHFEPLRHYAEVNLKIEQGLRGTGIIFKNEAHNDNLLPGFQNLVRTHIFEREHKGILTGSDLTDLKITLITGRGHNQYTNGGDFREATKRALRQGLETANNILLEPYYKFDIDVDIELMGRIISDIQRMHGSFDSPTINKDRVIISGVGPVSTFMNYTLEFQDFTRGKGSLSFVFSGYDICHNTEEIIEKVSYDKEADTEYTSSSIFCIRGAGYSVPWHEAKEKMHCLK